MIGLKIKIHPKRPRRLDKASKQFKPGMRKALLKVGPVIQQEARSRVRVLTGALRKSIEYVVKPFKKGWRLLSGSNVKTGQPLHYASKQEELTQFLSGAWRIKRRAIMQIIRKYSRKLFR